MEELPFNELDAAIFAELSYLDLEKIAPYFIDGKGRIPLKSLNLTQIKELSKLTLDAPNCEALLKRVSKAPRFMGLGIGLGHAVNDKRKVIQFAAFTFFLPDGTLYIAYRGTDTTLLGWKEDFQLAYREAIPSHKEALEYAKQVLDWYPKAKFYLGGHSKGGNLASYVLFHLENTYMGRLLSAYSFDGPGFKKAPEKFEERKDKLQKYMTQEDLIGCFFNLIENPHVVITNNPVAAGGHNPFTWQVDLKKIAFKRAKERSKASIDGEKAFMKVVLETPEEDISLAEDALFHVYSNCRTVFDLVLRLVPDFLKREEALNRYSLEERKKIKDFFERLKKALFKQDPEKKEKK